MELVQERHVTMQLSSP